MLGRGFQAACRFRRDNRGVVLVVFALLVLPLLVVTAAAIDFSQYLVVKRQLSGAIDAAALDLATRPGLTEPEAMERAMTLIDANLSADVKSVVTVQSVTPISDSNDIATVVAMAEIDTNFMKIAGVDKMSMTLTSSATRKESKLELVMVLDNTGSMRGSKLAALKNAATTLVDTLLAPANAEDFVKIGLVPFTTTVNVGTAYASASWMDTTGASPLMGENVDLVPGETLFTLFNRIPNLEWGGCVRARPEPYDTNDTPPDPSDPNTLFVPFFAPDEPDTGGYINNYMSDQYDPSMCSSGQSEAQCRQRNTAKYTQRARGQGPNKNCTVQSILPMTADKATLMAAISGMDADGNTVIPAGLAWGWHLISQNEPFTQGAPYTDQDVIKAIVLLTDGANYAGGGENEHNKSAFSAYGYAAEGGHLGNPDGTEADTVLDNKLTALCNNIKANHDDDVQDQDIIIYTIALDVPSGSSIDALLRNCATDASKHFNSPTSTELESTLQKIAIGLNKLRLVK